MNRNMKMLCLASTCTVLVQVANAGDDRLKNYVNKVDGLPVKNDEDFKHLMIVKSWQNAAFGAIAKKESDEGNSFITNQRYDDSIFAVISKAIADCLQKKNEFAKFWDGDSGASKAMADIDEVNKDNEGNIGFAKWQYWVKRFVTFDVTPKTKTYNRANWNAFLLYNYLNWKLHFDGELVGKSDDDDEAVWLIDKIADWTKTTYLSKGLSLLKAEVEEAVKWIDVAANDIKKYIEELDLDNYLTELRKANLEASASGGQLMPNNVLIRDEDRFATYRKKIGNSKPRSYVSGQFIVSRTDYSKRMKSHEIHTKYELDQSGNVLVNLISGDEYDERKKQCDVQKEERNNKDNLNINNTNNIINNNTSSYAKNGNINPPNMPKSMGGNPDEFQTLEKHNSTTQNPQSNAPNKMIITAPNGGAINSNDPSIRNMPPKVVNQPMINNSMNNINKMNNMNNINNMNMNNMNNMNRQFGQFGMNNNMNNINNMSNMNRGNFNNNINMNLNNINMNPKFGMNNNWNNINKMNNMNNINNMNMNNMHMNMNNMNMNLNINNNNNMNWINDVTDMARLTMVKAEPKLRLVKQIRNLSHNVSNGKDGMIPTTRSKCYFNSTMQCLANLEVMYSAVESSYRHQQRNNSWYDNVISAIYGLLQACRDGSMAYITKIDLPKAWQYDDMIRRLYKGTLDGDAEYTARRNLEIKNQQVNPESLKAELAEVQKRQSKENNSLRDHLLCDYSWHDIPELRRDGYSPILLMLEIMRQLIDQMRAVGIRPPMQPQFYMFGKPHTEEERGKVDSKTECFRMLQFERYGYIPLPTGNINSLKNYNDWYNTNYFQNKNQGFAIQELPQVLIYTYQGTKDQINNVFKGSPLILPDKIQLRDSKGMKTYRLNSFVSSTAEGGGHYLPILRTKNGWATINDFTKDPTGSIEKAKGFYNETTGKAEYPQVIFYEQLVE